MNIRLALLGLVLCFSGWACSSNNEHSQSEPNNPTREDVPVFSAAPASYSSEIAEAGRMESVSYTTHNAAGAEVSKTAYVYLPYGYDREQQYNILYLMHGGGGNQATLMGTPDHPLALKHILDHMIQDKLIAPLLIVTPSFYTEGSDGSMAAVGELTHQFQEELRNELMPVVEGRYSTYAEGTSEADFTNSRDHRAFSGFSMGSVTTWYAVAENLAYFRYFIPASGDCWAITQMGGASQPAETASYLANAIREQGYSLLDLFIFAVTGTRDIAHDNLTPQIEAMRALADDFVYDYRPEQGNLYYLDVEGGVHDYSWFNDYLYTILPILF